MGTRWSRVAKPYTGTWAWRHWDETLGEYEVDIAIKGAESKHNERALNKPQIITVISRWNKAADLKTSFVLPGERGGTGGPPRSFFGWDI